MVEVGKYTTISEIKNQSEARWVVLVDLHMENDDILGGKVHYIARTKTLAGNKAIALERKGIETYVSMGASDEICIGAISL